MTFNAPIINLKEGVQGPITDEMRLVANFISIVWKIKLNKQLTITSMQDGVHMKGSKHYEGKAIDIRNRDLSETEKASMMKCLKEILTECDVIQEKDHIHIELKKQKGGKNMDNETAQNLASVIMTVVSFLVGLLINPKKKKE